MFHSFFCVCIFVHLLRDFYFFFILFSSIFAICWDFPRSSWGAAIRCCCFSGCSYFSSTILGHFNFRLHLLYDTQHKRTALQFFEHSFIYTHTHAHKAYALFMIHCSQTLCKLWIAQMLESKNYKKSSREIEEEKSIWKSFKRGKYLLCMVFTYNKTA